MTEKFKLFQNVKFIGPPDFCPEIAVGEIGGVLEVYGKGWYEVEFIFPDGSTKALQAFSDAHLENVSPINKNA
jgi:hypothetical protein